jgi:hypothetical protein
MIYIQFILEDRFPHFRLPLVLWQPSLFLSTSCSGKAGYKEIPELLSDIHGVLSIPQHQRALATDSIHRLISTMSGSCIVIGHLELRSTHSESKTNLGLQGIALSAQATKS